MASRQLLALRPANAARQLGKIQLALLGLRQVLPVMHRLGRPLWYVVLEEEGQAEAVLRAASRLRAVVGLCLWPGDCPTEELRFRHSPDRIFRDICRAAAAVENCGPFLLHAQLPVTDKLEALCDYAHACIEAGFTSLGISFSSRDVDVQFATSVLAPAQQYELGIMLETEHAWRESLMPRDFRLDVWLGKGSPPELVKGWANRLVPPPFEAPGHVVIGPLEKGSGRETTEALSYAAALEYIENYSLVDTAELLERVFSS